MMNALLRSRRSWALVAALAVAALLPACTFAPSDLTLNRIETKPVQLTHVVHFAPGSAALASAEADSLRSFLRSGVASINSVTLVSGTSSIADARRASVSRAIGALGLPYSVAPADPNFTADVVDVTATGEAAVPPSCPNWDVVGPYDPSNASMRNLGCATNTDLYLMVADPRDLVTGHALAPADAQPSIGAVEAYRTGDQKFNPQEPSLTGGTAGSGSATTSGGGSTNGQ
jgi:pilus assembly protein CpaD